jgi:L-fuculokinase
MNAYHIAVVDAGKTNKKILVYDQDLQPVSECMKRFEERDFGDYRSDDVSSFTDWMLDSLAEFGRDYNIRAISVSTHGATFAAIDEAGDYAVPPISYTTDPGVDFHRAFYERCGDRIHLQKITGTPDFNLLINLAKGIYFAQRRFPDAFGRVRHILNYPQYLGYVLTGRIGAEPTYTGNHTYLWDFEKKSWSEVAERLGIRHLLPDTFLQPWDVLGSISGSIARRTGLHPNTLVTAGIHDSNASLLPYLLSQPGDFMLNSTGTWCVVMHGVEKVQFAPDELGKVVFFNLNAFFQPVKTAIFLGGLEFDYYNRLLGQTHGDVAPSVMDEPLYRRIIRERRLFILPGVVGGIGQFPESEARIAEGDRIYRLKDIESGKLWPEFFNDSATAVAVLNLSLAIQTSVCFDRAGMRSGLPVFTEGGFSRNEAYNALLAALYPESSFYLTDLREATAFGTALLGKAALERVDLKRLAHCVRMEKQAVNRPELDGLEAYRARFMELI